MNPAYNKAAKLAMITPQRQAAVYPWPHKTSIVVRDGEVLRYCDFTGLPKPGIVVTLGETRAELTKMEQTFHWRGMACELWQYSVVD